MASIPLQIKPIETASPLQSVGQLMQLRGQMADLALRQQQQRQAEQQTNLIDAEQQQRNRDLADQNTLQGLMKDPNESAKINRGDFSSLEGKVQPSSLLNWKKSIADFEQKELANNVQQNTLKRDAMKDISEGAGGLLSLKDKDGNFDAAAATQALPGVIQNLHSLGAFTALGITDDQIPKHVDNEDQVKQIVAHFFGGQALYDKILGQQKEKQAITASEAQTKESTAKATQSQAEADTANFKLNLMKNAMSGNQAGIDQNLQQRFGGNPEALAAAKAAWQQHASLGDLDGAQKALDNVFDKYIGAAAQAKSETPARVAQAVATAQATAPVEIGKAVATQKALAAQSPDAFANVRPNLQGAAMTEADQISKTASDQVNTSQQLLDTINAAQKGNRAAPGLISLQAVRQFVTRPNVQELRGVGNAGSALDRITGWVQGHTEGEPIPANILNDLKSVAQIGADNANRVYQQGLLRLKNRGVDTSKLVSPDLTLKDATAPKRISNKAEFDALPKGAVYIDPADGRTYRKP